MNSSPFQAQAKKKSLPVNTDNFLEALKSIGGGVARGFSHDVVAGTAQTAFDTLVHGPSFSASGDLNPGQSIDMVKMQTEQAEKQTQLEHKRLHQMRVKEEMVFSAEQEQTKREIESLKAELKKMAQEMGEVAREVQIAAMQSTDRAGQYHVSFFNHLKSLIQAMRKELHESRNWMHAVNARSAKKQGYWGQFQKQGTSFSMNNERTLATSAG